MSKHIDVTELVDFDNPDDESLPMTKCVCGEKFPVWNWSISIYDDNPTHCPECGRKFFFRQAIRVYQVVEE